MARRIVVPSMALVIAAVLLPSAAAGAQAVGRERVSVVALGPGAPRFIEALYKDLLSRPSDTAGRDFWVQRLASGTSRGTLTRQMAGSSEWRRKVVDGLYASILGRAPTTGERDAGVADLQAKLRVADLAARLLGSTEFYGRSGSTSDGFARALSLSARRRPPTTAEVTKVRDDLRAGRTRTAIAREVFLSVEANGVRVDDMYALLLGRRPDGPGRAYWAGILVTRDDIWMAAAVTNGGEYYTRAQHRVVEGSYTVPTTTEVIPGAQVRTVSRGPAGSATVTVPASTPAEVGDVIVAQPGPADADGVIGRVTGRAVTGAGAILTTSHASWDEAFTEMDLEGTLDAPSRPVSIPPPGTGGARAASNSCTFGVSVTPRASVSVDTQLQWGPFQTDIVRFVANAQVGATLGTTLTGSTSCGIELDLFSLPVQLGPITVVLEGGIDVGVSASTAIQAYAGASTICSVGAESVDGELTDLTGCESDASAGLLGTQQPFAVLLSAHAHLTLSAKAFGIVGLGAHVGPGFELRGEACGSPWWTVDSVVTAGLDLVVGAWFTEISWTLAERELDRRTIASGGTGAPCARGWTGTVMTHGAVSYQYPINGSLYGLPSVTSGTLHEEFRSEIRWGEVHPGNEQDLETYAYLSIRTAWDLCYDTNVPGFVVGPPTVWTSEGSAAQRWSANRLEWSPTYGWGRGLEQVYTQVHEVRTLCGDVEQELDRSFGHFGTAWYPHESALALAPDVGARELDYTVAVPARAAACASLPTCTPGSLAGTVTYRVRVTNLPDADADGIPDTRDARPSTYDAIDRPWEAGG